MRRIYIYRIVEFLGLIGRRGQKTSRRNEPVDLARAIHE